MTASPQTPDEVCTPGIVVLVDEVHELLTHDQYGALIRRLMERQPEAAAKADQEIDTLRRAAAGMRRRALSLQHFGTPWRTHPEPDDRGSWLVGYPTNNPLSGLIATTPDYGDFVLADHVAAFHPGVALALADAMDNEATGTLLQRAVGRPLARPSRSLVAAAREYLAAGGAFDTADEADTDQ